MKVSLGKIFGLRTFIAILAAAILLSGCTGEIRPPSASEQPSEAKVNPVPVVVSRDDGTDFQVQMTPPELTTEVVQSIDETIVQGTSALGMELLFSAPVEISAEETIPPEGVILTKRFEQPLPEEAVASFIYFNENLGTWLATPSEISSDRTTLTATIHHFSIWSTIVSWRNEASETVRKGIQKSIDIAIDARDFVTRTKDGLVEYAQKDLIDDLYYATGNALGTRAEAPSCEGSEPEWVDDSVFIEDNKSNPIRFCTGSAGNNLLQAKATVNRSYGFNFDVKAPHVSMELSGNSLNVNRIKDDILNVDQAISRSTAELLSSDGIVAPGATISLSFDQDSVASSKDPLILSFNQPSIPVFLLSTVASMAVQTGLGIDDSWISATLALGQCVDAGFSSFDSLPQAANALATCIATNEEQIAQKVAVGLSKSKIVKKEARVIAARLVGTMSLWMVLVSASSSGMDYIMQSMTHEASLQLKVWAKPGVSSGPRVTDISVHGPWSSDKTTSVFLDPWNNPKTTVIDRNEKLIGDFGCAQRYEGTNTIVCIGEDGCVYQNSSNKALCRPHSWVPQNKKDTFDLNKWRLVTLSRSAIAKNISSDKRVPGHLIALKLSNGKICTYTIAEGAYTESPGYVTAWGICEDGKFVWFPSAGPNNDKYLVPFLSTKKSEKLRVAVGTIYETSVEKIDVDSLYY